MIPYISLAFMGGFLIGFGPFFATERVKSTNFVGRNNDQQREHTTKSHP